jgi:hypothetical protein
MALHRRPGQAWRVEAAAQLAELLNEQAKYDEFNALPPVRRFRHSELHVSRPVVNDLG